jgi:hypothetical protein
MTIPKSESYKYGKDGKLLQKHKPIGKRTPAKKNEAAIKAAKEALKDHMEKEEERSQGSIKSRQQEPGKPISEVKTNEMYFQAIIERLDKLIEIERNGAKS